MEEEGVVFCIERLDEVECIRLDIPLFWKEAEGLTLTAECVVEPGWYPHYEGYYMVSIANISRALAETKCVEALALLKVAFGDAARIVDAVPGSNILLPIPISCTRLCNKAVN